MKGLCWIATKSREAWRKYMKRLLSEDSARDNNTSCFAPGPNGGLLSP